MHFGLGLHQIDELAWSYWLGKDRYIIADMNVAENFEEKNNDLAVFAAANPAFSMVTDAANLAAFYEFLVNGGVRTMDIREFLKISSNFTLPDKYPGGINLSKRIYP